MVSIHRGLLGGAGAAEERGVVLERHPSQAEAKRSHEGIGVGLTETSETSRGPSVARPGRSPVDGVIRHLSTR
jgi:hypothetical protein